MKDYRFLSAYSFADNVVRTVEAISDVDLFSDFLDSEPSFLEVAFRPKKKTLLHIFIYNLNLDDLGWSTGHFPTESVEEYQAILASARLEMPDRLTAEEVGEHIRELDALLAQASAVITEATFHILFSDREFLAKFQGLVAEVVRASYSASTAHYYQSPGILRRQSSLPSWLRRAVFLRDKGRCQKCLADLTGVLALDPKLHLDHILPLAESGTNDPCNFQLLCEKCNLRKGRSFGGWNYRTATYW